MKKLNTAPKIFAFVAILSGALWLGSYVARLILSYNLFLENDFVLKEFVTQENLQAVLLSFAPTIPLSSVLYLVFITGFTIFLFISHISLKKNGWLFIIVAIIYLTLPFELYLMVTIDYKLISAFLSGIDNANEFLSLMKDRFKVLGSFPIILIWCYITIPYFLLFRPFTISENKDED
jgi:hypothetical protein